jgi:hypothetical protein
MVGSCPSCKRPWYSRSPNAFPLICKGCGNQITDYDQYETDSPSNQQSPQSNIEQTAPIQTNFQPTPNLNNYQNSPISFEVNPDQESSNNTDVIMIVIGILMMIGAGIWAYDTYQFKTNAMVINGKITAQEQWRSTKGTSKAIYHFEYYVNGSKHTIRGSSQDSHKEGDIVPLLVSKTDPEDAREPTGLYTNKTFIAGFGLFVLLGGLFLRYVK